MLGSLCDELEAAGIATMSDGALCVFLDGYTGREGKPVPLIIRKSDGGYGYATTDLATIRYRVHDLKAHRVLYVIGAPQALHLNMVWDTARKAGWLPDDVVPVHVQIGNVLGEDRKILKTRSGKPLRLMMLLDEAVEKARAVIDDARPDLDEAVRATIARQIGIGAVKYADLSVAHNSEYVFDLDRMVALTGNTGPYLQYVVARIRSIFRQVALDPAQQRAPILVEEPQERALALHLLGFGDVLAEVGDDVRAAPPLRLPLRAGPDVLGVLRELPGAQGRPRRGARVAALALRARPPRHDDRSRPARPRGPRADVNRGAGARAGRDGIPAAVSSLPVRTHADLREWAGCGAPSGTSSSTPTGSCSNAAGRRSTSSPRSSTCSATSCATASASCRRRSCSTASGVTVSSASRR